ncbi:hypothetical protein GJ496_004729 [Pomphorhynchus laevis]|nr:hypothetical protein GJ496_004729 [Pomphorhynchus laevis]
MDGEFIKHFEQDSVTIKNDGIKMLGSYIGTEEFRKQKIETRVAEWIDQISLLTEVAKCDSQVAYTMLTKSLQNQWTYLQRTCEINREWLNPLSEMIFKKLVPEIIGIPNIDMELRSIICLPLRLGGMGVCDPSTEPKTEFERSQPMESPIINAN